MPEKKRCQCQDQYENECLSSPGHIFSNSSRTRLPQLQGRKREECKDQSKNPEADNDLGLRPASQLKVVMHRRHFEYSFFTGLVRSHLDDDRKRFKKKNPADEGQQKLLLDDYSHGADSTAQRQRAYIAHKDFRRMRVVPEEPDARSHHGPAKYRDLRHLRHFL